MGLGVVVQEGGSVPRRMLFQPVCWKAETSGNCRDETRAISRWDEWQDDIREAIRERPHAEHDHMI